MLYLSKKSKGVCWFNYLHDVKFIMVIQWILLMSIIGFREVIKIIKKINWGKIISFLKDGFVNHFFNGVYVFLLDNDMFWDANLEPLTQN